MVKKNSLVVKILGGIFGFSAVGVIVFFVVKSIIKKNKFIKYANSVGDYNSIFLSKSYDAAVNEMKDPEGWEIGATLNDEQFEFLNLVITIYNDSNLIITLNDNYNDNYNEVDVIDIIN